MSKYIKKEFSPHLFRDWTHLFKSCSTEQRSELLLAITDYPNYEPNIEIPIWNFINSQLDNQYQSLVSKSEQMSANANRSQQKPTEVNKCSQTRIKTEINNNNINNILNNIGKGGKNFLISDDFSCSMFSEFEPYLKEMPADVIKSVENWLKKEKKGQTVTVDFITRQFINFANRQNKPLFKGN